MLRLVNVNSYYSLVHVLKNVSIHVNEGEIVSMLGANGAGKTTMLRTISGLQPVYSGQVYFNGQEITHMNPEKLVEMGIAHVSEGRQIFQPMSVHDNLELGGHLIYKRYGRKTLKADIEKIFGLFPILRQRRQQYAGTLSGGEQQMLAIGRSLMSNPEMLLLDEPSLGIAPILVKAIFQQIKKISQEGVTVLLVEQNAKAALKLADRAYVLDVGKIVLSGTSEELLASEKVQEAYLGKKH